MSSNNFKVIVVGGGPVGLTAAHALTKAGIDFLMLEQRPNAVIDAGSNLVMSPIGLRALAQLDLLEQINAVSSALGRIDRMDHNGRDIGNFPVFTILKETLGIAPRVISRHDLTRVLYNTLPSHAQHNILTNKKLSDIATTSDGVLVTCRDGSSYAGSIVVGADGAHSMVREIMRKLSLSSVNSEAASNDEKPFLTTYRALWIRFPKFEGLAVGTTCETHGHNAATQLFVGEESGVIGVYEKMDEPTRERVRYTQADQDALVERWGHIPVARQGKTKLTLRDVYSSRLEAGIVSLEEGVVDHWSWNGRIVLAGDAAHKFTPSTGAGCNNGVIDIIALVNQLHALPTTSSTPSTAELELAFAAYQSQRAATAASECAASSRATEMATWQNGVLRFVDQWVMSSHTIMNFLIGRRSQASAQTPSFNLAAGAVPNEKAPCVVPPVRAVTMVN